MVRVGVLRIPAEKMSTNRGKETQVQWEGSLGIGRMGVEKTGRENESRP